MTTFWLTFCDPDAPTDKRFLGVAIFDMDESGGRLSAEEIVEQAWKLGINPGGAVNIFDATHKNGSIIKPEHKNKLITDDELLLSLGSKGRLKRNTN
jgi:hypothetical protein